MCAPFSSSNGIRRRGPVEIRDAQFLRRHAAGATKITLPGPFTLSQQAQNGFYADEEEMSMAYAAAVGACEFRCQPAHAARRCGK